MEKKKKSLVEFLQEEFNFPIKKGSVGQSISPSLSDDAEPALSLGEKSLGTRHKYEPFQKEP